MTFEGQCARPALWLGWALGVLRLAPTRASARCDQHAARGCPIRSASSPPCPPSRGGGGAPLPHTLGVLAPRCSQRQPLLPPLTLAAVARGPRGPPRHILVLVLAPNGIANGMATRRRAPAKEHGGGRQREAEHPKFQSRRALGRGSADPPDPPAPAHTLGGSGGGIAAGGQSVSCRRGLGRLPGGMPGATSSCGGWRRRQSGAGRGRGRAGAGGRRGARRRRGRGGRWRQYRRVMTVDYIDWRQGDG